MEKYLSYTIEELALEESFINWVKDANPTDVSFWNNWLKANPDEVLKIEKAKKLVGHIQFKEKKLSKEREDALWKRINKQTEQAASPELKTVTTKRRTLLPWVGVAAGLLALVYVMIGGNTNMEMTTSIAQMETINLPDGSVVNLNAGSTLKYDRRSFDTDRVILLDGEAFFNVQKGSTFTVKTKIGKVEVLGTSFNVYSRKTSLKVNCETGKVAVHSGTDKTILIADEQVEILSNKVHVKSNEKNAKRSDWKNGIYHYDNTELQSIVEDIERQWKVTVDIEDGLQEIKFTGSFKTDHIENAIAEVCWPLGVKYELKNKKIRIFKD